jgi:uncharacterized membrane protein
MRQFPNYPMYGPRAEYPVWHLIGGLVMLAILGMLVYLTITMIRRNRSGRATVVPPVATPMAPATVPTPLEIAQMRYARGEITREEYETLRQDLST